MTEQERESAAKQHFHAMARRDLERIAFQAWRYHRQSAQLCAVHDLGEDEATSECICTWKETLYRSSQDELYELLPD